MRYAPWFNVVMSPIPSSSILHECFTFSEDSSSFLLWKERPRHHFPTSRAWNGHNATRIGKTAGSTFIQDGKVRWRVGIFGSVYLVNRVIYTMFKGVVPEDAEVDHIDRNTQNNHYSNLRLSDRSENASNKSIQENNTSGVRGVVWCKRTQRWMAQIGLKRKCIFLGRYKNKEDAVAARVKASQNLHGEFQGIISMHLSCENNL